MIEPGAVLDVAALGVRVEMRCTGAESHGELVEFDVVGRARGFLVQPHVHERQTERHEVIDGSLRVVIDGRQHVLGPGESIAVPAGATHRQIPAGAGPGRVRVQLRPARSTEAVLERLHELSAGGALNRWGFPRPLAAAALVRDFAEDNHMAGPSVALQRRVANALLGAASREYVFADEWDVDAPREAVFDAIADARSYPLWWRPVYIDVESEGEPALGKESLQHFKGRLPYHLHTRSRITQLDPPATIGAEVDGDLRGRGLWTLTEAADGRTHVRFDWQVFADRRLLAVLTPVLRPLLRANHAWAIARARDGLEPYARARSRAVARI